VGEGIGQKGGGWLADGGLCFIAGWTRGGPSLDSGARPSSYRAGEVLEGRKEVEERICCKLTRGILCGCVVAGGGVICGKPEQFLGGLW